MSAVERIERQAEKLRPDSIPVAWISSIVILGSTAFGITLIARPLAFAGPAYRIVLDRDHGASPMAWGVAMCATAAIYAVMLVVDRSASWIAAVVTLLLNFVWMFFVLVATIGEPLGGSPIAAFILCMISTAIIVHRALATWDHGR